MMSTTWFIAKEYLKRLQISYEENGRKTFSLYPHGPTKTEQIEMFPGADWITLTTRLFDLSSIPPKDRREFYETLLKTNASLVEANFGVDKKDFVILRNAIPVTGISYDAFSSAYGAHIAGVRFFQTKMLPVLLRGQSEAVLV